MASSSLLVDDALELAVQQALRRIKDNAKRDVEQALPRAVSNFVLNSAECAALKQRTLRSVDEEVRRRCEGTLDRLARDVVCREALARAAEAQASAATQQLRYWLFGVGVTAVLSLACAGAALAGRRWTR
jgi:hypothetical protein